MHEYLFDVETVHLAVVIGVIVSMLFYERLQLTTGGAIVPGYLALFLPHPFFIVVTLVTAYLTYVFVNRILAKRLIIYGRRKFELEILTALVLVSAGVLAAQAFGTIHPFLLALYGIGFVIPGIIAHDMFRQKPKKTIIAILVNTGFIGVIIYIFHSLMSIAPWHHQQRLGALSLQTFGYPIDLLLVAVIVSVLVGMVVFAKLGLRSGGFVTGAYLALVLLRPLDLLFAALVSLITYFFVTKVLMERMLLFGRRKMSMMVLAGASFAWAGEILVMLLTNHSYVPWAGFHVIVLMVPAFLANDAQRQGVSRTFMGAAISTFAVFAVVNLIEAGRLMLAASP